MIATLMDEFLRLRRGAGRRLRRWVYRLRCRRFGQGVEIADDVSLFYPQCIEIGDGVVLNDRVILQSCEGAGIRIGDRAVLSYGVYVLTGGRRLDEGRVGKDHETAPVTIGAEAWIGAGAILLPGVTVGAGAIVGAGAVVTKDVAEGSKVVGSPARPLR